MDIPILVITLIGMGAYSHMLLSRIADLREENASMQGMILSMAKELASLGSPNVFIEKSAT